jgi:hypothetical protein
MNAIQVLLQNSIDYAGLYPPAGFDMQAAVDNYARYHSGPNAWALGRFVLPVARLAEFQDAAGSQLRQPAGTPWPLSALLGPDVSAEVSAVVDFNRRHGSAACIDTLELKATSVSAIAEVIRPLPPHLQAYIEIPIDGDPAGLISAIGQMGRRAKVRTGGITEEAFPGASQLVRFMATSLRAGVAFKATAGLHHPLRAEYRLTYAPDSPRGMMYGFLNLFLTAAFLQKGMPEAEAQRVLEETSLDAFDFREEAVHWNGRRIGLPDLRRSREGGLVSFGSCSFTEPLEDLLALQLLDTKAARA